MIWISGVRREPPQSAVGYRVRAILEVVASSMGWMHHQVVGRRIKPAPGTTWGYIRPGRGGSGAGCVHRARAGCIRRGLRESGVDRVLHQTQAGYIGPWVERIRARLRLEGARINSEIPRARDHSLG